MFFSCLKKSFGCKRNFVRCCHYMMIGFKLKHPSLSQAVFQCHQFMMKIFLENILNFFVLHTKRTPGCYWNNYCLSQKTVSSDETCPEWKVYLKCCFLFGKAPGMSFQLISFFCSILELFVVFRARVLLLFSPFTVSSFFLFLIMAVVRRTNEF